MSDTTERMNVYGAIPGEETHRLEIGLRPADAQQETIEGLRQDNAELRARVLVLAARVAELENN